MIIQKAMCYEENNVNLFSQSQPYVAKVKFSFKDIINFHTGSAAFSRQLPRQTEGISWKQVPPQPFISCRRTAISNILRVSANYSNPEQLQALGYLERDRKLFIWTRTMDFYDLKNDPERNGRLHTYAENFCA